MIYDLIKNDFGKKENYNCSETILYAANEAYNLGLSKDALKLSAAFGGGMGIESTCGALTGAVMALSSIYVEDIGREDREIFDITKEFFKRYEDSMGSIECFKLKEDHKKEDIGCHNIILEAAKILDEIIEENPIN